MCGWLFKYTLLSLSSRQGLQEIVNGPDVDLFDSRLGDAQGVLAGKNGQLKRKKTVVA